MLALKDYRVFVSSTSMDLQEQREAAFRAITRLELIPVVMEGFGAHTHSPIEVCRSKVGECRYFVLIAGFMYGSTYEDGKSFTEHEYECAVDAGAKIKVFMMSDDAVVRGAFIEKGAGAEKLEAFKRRLRTNHTVQYFETADQLGTLIKDTYSTDQLVQIFCRMAGDRGFTVACVDALPGAMEALRRSAGFSNARTARKLVDHAVVEASWARDEAVITADDLECALPQCLGAPARRPAGF